MKWNSRLMETWEWNAPIVNEKQKQKVASRVASFVKEGDVIGVGSGSTSYMALQAIARRVKEEHLNIQAIPTSQEMMWFCIQAEIPVTTLEVQIPDWSFDGADEVDPDHNLIKGRGGAMFKEKLMIMASPRTYIMVDRSKIVSTLGLNFPVPVEVFPSAIRVVEREMEYLSPSSVHLRTGNGKDGPVITENGNLILDVWFRDIPISLEKDIKAIPGVVESGLFMGYKNIGIVHD